MKRLIYDNEIYGADKIIKTATDIIGYDLSNNEVFKFTGITDFTKFTLSDGIEFDMAEPSAEERLKSLEDAMLFMMMGGM